MSTILDEENPKKGVRYKANSNGVTYYAIDLESDDQKTIDSVASAQEYYQSVFDYTSYNKSMSSFVAGNRGQGSAISSVFINNWTQGSKLQRNLRAVENIGDKTTIDTWNSFLYGQTGFRDIRFRKDLSKKKPDGNLGYKMNQNQFREEYPIAHRLDNYLANLGSKDAFTNIFEEIPTDVTMYREKGVYYPHKEMVNNSETLVNSIDRNVTDLHFTIPKKEVGFLGADFLVKDGRLLEEFSNNLRKYNLTIDDLKNLGVVVEPSAGDRGGLDFSFNKNLENNLALKILDCIPNRMLQGIHNTLNLEGRDSEGNTIFKDENNNQGRIISSIQRMIGNLKYDNDKVNRAFGDKQYAEVHNITITDMPMYDCTPALVNGLKNGTVKYSTFRTIDKDLETKLINLLKTETNTDNLLVTGISNKYNKKGDVGLFAPLENQSEWSTLVSDPVSKNKESKSIFADKDIAVQFGYDNGNVPGFIFTVTGKGGVEHQIFWKANNEYAKQYASSNEVLINQISQNVDNGSEFARFEGGESVVKKGERYYIKHDDGSVNSESLGIGEEKALYTCDLLKDRLQNEVFSSNSNVKGVIVTKPLRQVLLTSTIGSFAAAYDKSIFNGILNNSIVDLNNEPITIDQLIHTEEEGGVSDDYLTPNQSYFRKYVNELYDYLERKLNEIDNINNKYSKIK